MYLWLPKSRCSSRRSSYFSALGISVEFWSSNTVSRARQTPTSRKMEKSEGRPGGTSSPVSPPWPDPFRKPKQMLRHPVSKCVFLFAIPGRGLRPVITSAVTNPTFLVKCRLVRWKRSLPRHYKTASAEVVWPTPDTFFQHPRAPNFHPSSRRLKPVRAAAATRIHVASGSLLGGAWQAEPRLLSIFSKLYL